MAANINEDQKAFYTAEFNSYAKNGVISDINTWAKLTRALGQLYTPQELQNSLGGSKTLQGFLDLMGSTLVREDTAEDIQEAFKVYDKDGNSMIQVTDLRFVLVNQGDRLDDDQAEQIIGRISTYNGQFNYRDLITEFSKLNN